LLSNANKFTEQGNITLAIRRTNTPRTSSLDHAHAAEHGGWIQFQISDTGIGITDEQMKKIFEPFTQADPSTTRKYGGTGLGLAITRQFCMMMGGIIMLESNIGQGTTFTIELPAFVQKEPVSSSSAQSATIMSPHTTQERDTHSTILVIDDDATVRELMHRLLTKEGFFVVTTDNGKDGIRLAQELHPTAITLDVMMPELDGWTVLSRLKADSQIHDIPVILVSMIDERTIGYTLGASEYLLKPVQRERLIEVIERYCKHPTSKSILLVEDEPDVRELVRRTLEKEGWTVREAWNGQDALDKLQEQIPDVIVLDLMMPEMDGFEFVNHLHSASSVWQDIPLLVLTAMELTNEERQRLNGHVQRIFQKGGTSQYDIVRDVSAIVAAHNGVTHRVSST
jgi:CheY-like chemotaxis protein